MATQLIGAARAPFPSLARSSRVIRTPFSARFARYQPFGGDLDPADIAEARNWYRAFDGESLPKGDSTFSRSSGPGGQHVNKTESKATTAWAISKLVPDLPKLMRPRLRNSRYYTAGNDSLTFQAQTERRRAANLGDNKEKLVEELRRIYQEAVPGESDPEKVKKHQEIAKSFHEIRIHKKKQLSSKKQLRRASCED